MRTLSRRRYRGTPSRRATANEVASLPLEKSIELEARLARVEQLLEHACEQLKAAQQRHASAQAQLDHLAARIELIR